MQTELPPTVPPQPPPPSDPLLSPYSDTDKLIRVQCCISEQDHIFIRCIRPGNGTILGVLSILWHKLCTSLRDREITDYSKKNEFEQFLSKSVLIDADEYRAFSEWRGHSASNAGPNPSSGGSLSETAGGDDGKRTKGVRKIRSNDATKRGDVQS